MADNISAMKKVSFTLLLSLFASLALAQQTAKEKKALNLLKKYDPEGYFIITQTINSPGRYEYGNLEITLGSQSGFDFYIDGESTEEIIESLGTVVHEMTHSYTSRMVYTILQAQQTTPQFGDKYRAIHTRGEDNILVKETETFPSKELLKVIPEELRTYRFDTYINSDMEILATQKSGIYGLLDEFSAYYHDSQTAYNLYDYYMEETERTNADYLAYMSDFNSGFYAYVEFRHYILTYLLYAKENYPLIYSDIVANDSFKKAFLTIEAQYAQLIADYFTRIEEIAETLENQGITVRFEEKYTYIGYSGVGNFMEEYNLLKTEMEKEKYVQMMQTLQQ